MPIVAPQPPDAALEAIRRTVRGRGRPSLPRAVRRRAGSRPVSLTVPQQVFAARLDALAEGQGLEGAVEASGWRMLVEEHGEVVAAAEVHGHGAQTGGPAQLNRGPFVSSTVDAIIAVEQQKRVRDEDFELRLLRVPALQLDALWLRARTGDDVVVPLAPAPPPLEANRPYDAGEFGLTAAALAREALAAWGSAERPDELGS